MRDTLIDRVQIGFVRRGSVAVVGRVSRQQVRRGELVAWAPQTTAEVVPGAEGVAYTSIFVDRLLLEQSVAWAAGASAPTKTPDTEGQDDSPAPDGLRWARIGERVLRELEPCLDELVELTSQGQLRGRFGRAAAILFTVLDAIAPALEPPEAGLQRPLRPTRPVRSEVRRAVALLESDLARPWRVDELAAASGLSAGHLRQLFLDGLGRTPLAHHNLLRARRAQELLGDRSRSIPEVMAEVGWASPNHWSTMFRRHTGMTPREYRDRS
ncbi:AraC family transcriptional regulator [Nocardioides sp. W7]|uniref:helix-turn-helix domain-containing protein n=1 Tax=Nocardioides sp. W7 TaxID=2931390 RepID=UPI001FD0E62B|nr:AraC family transcriptional regulator [Nocardioides sp. W7]